MFSFTFRRRRFVLIALALALAIAPAGCSPSGVSFSYLRSEAYEFSAADRRLIEGIAERAVADVRIQLPSLPPKIELTIRPGTDVIKETGETAAAMPPQDVIWTVDPSQPAGVAGVANSWLRATLFHELHHLARSVTSNPQSLVERAVFEGMATVFERDFAHVAPPWGQYPDNVSEWAADLARQPADSPVRDWLFTHPDGRRWLGIRVGTYWVDRAMATSRRSSASLVSVPASEIIALANAPR